MGSKLVKCRTLETPHDFLEVIKKELPTEGGREVITEELPGAFDFQSFFDIGESLQPIEGVHLLLQENSFLIGGHPHVLVYFGR